jgi:hypothetical protein
MITSVEDLIERFGGIKPFAEMIGVSLPPVYRAKDLNKLPYRWRPRLYREVKRRRLKVDPALLGFDDA